MSDPRDEERELRTLFENSAAEPSAPTLTKLRARSVDIPARTRRRRLTFGLLVPALVGGLALVIALAPKHRSSPIAQTAAPSPTLAFAPQSTAPEKSAASPSRAAPETSAAPETETATDDIVDDTDDTDDGASVDLALGGSVLDSDLGGGAGEGLEAVDEPPPDADLDAWLRATDDLLKGGG